MASTLKLNTLTGASTAGSIAVTGEGNSTTTNLQQGLLKCWGISNDGANNLDSFNVGSATDNSTGNYTKTFTNNMASTSTSFTGTSSENTYGTIFNSARATSSITIKCENITGAALDCVIGYQLAGDLA